MKKVFISFKRILYIILIVRVVFLVRIPVVYVRINKM